MTKNYCDPEERVMTLEDYVQACSRTIDPLELGVLRSIDLKGFKPTWMVWNTMLGALKIARCAAVERDKPNVVRTYRDGCEVLEVRHWKAAAAERERMEILERQQMEKQVVQLEELFEKVTDRVRAKRESRKRSPRS